MPRRAESCYSCGTLDARTRDHVFPKSLFTAPRPNPSPTVPACESCQKLTRLDEDYFRNLVAAGAYGHETGRALWDGPIRRSFRRNAADLRTFAGAMREMDFRSDGGIYLGTLVGVEGDQERFGNVLQKIVRGLFYLETKTVMPNALRWGFEQVTPQSPKVPDVTRDLIRSMPLRKVGNVVKYKFAIAPGEPRLTLTWLAFYDRTMFLVHTLPEGDTPYDDGLP